MARETNKVFHRAFFLRGPAGRLEAMLWSSLLAEPPLAAVVCHPHPLYGGTMHNRVVFRAARTLQRFGVPVLRFNFRGAGLSEGRHDAGRGEQDDVRVALDYLAAQFPSPPLLLAGFSFGAWVGLRVGCADARVTELIGLGLPVNDSDLSYLRACHKPKLLVQGNQDQFGSRERLEALVASFREASPALESAGLTSSEGGRGGWSAACVPQAASGGANPLARLPTLRTLQTELVIVPGADHFFTGQLDQLDAAISSWLLRRHPYLKPAAKSLEA